MKNYFQNIKKIFKKTSIIILVCLFFLFFYFFLIKELFLVKPSVTVFNTSEVASTTCNDCVPRLIDGILVDKSQSSPALFTATIDNHIDARPPVGLAEAKVVYEAEAEGGISRFLAVFIADNSNYQIGPIRSARPYFVDWAAEYSSLFLHCGGSPDGLNEIKILGLNDLDEFYNSKFFWREATRSAPHNILTSESLISQYFDQKNIKEKPFDPWLFKNENPISDGSPLKIKIAFFSPDYMPSWSYDKQNNDFIRYLDNKQAADQEGDLIRAKNLIIQYNQTKVVDEKLRLQINTLGEGKIILCQDGKCEAGQWLKKTPEARTRYYRENGEEFEFNPGITWIEVIDSDNQLTIE